MDDRGITKMFYLLEEIAGSLSGIKDELKEIRKKGGDGDGESDSVREQTAGNVRGL